MPSTRSQAVWRQSPMTAFVSRMRPNDADKAGKFTRSITMCDWRTRPSRKSILRYHAFQPGRDGDRGRRSLSPSHCSEGRRRGGQGREAPGSTLARRDGGWQVLSFDFACPISRQRFSLLGSQTEPRKRGPKGRLIGLQSAFYEFVGPAGAPSRSHSSSFDHRRRPEMLRTAIATAFFWPTITTSRLPRVTPV
jgi:hypothetical protein